MNILWITYYNLLRFSRARRSSFQMMVFPIIILFILGSALSPLFGYTEIDTISVGLLDKGNSPLSAPMKEFLDSEEIREMLFIVSVDSQEEGEELMQQGRIRALIELDSFLPTDESDLPQGGITLYFNPRHAFQNDILKNLFESFANGANAVYGAMHLTQMPASYAPQQNIRRNDLAQSGNAVSAMDYYGVTILVMILMYGANYSFYSFVNETQEGQTRRIQSAPLRNYEIFFGKTFASVGTVFCQVMILLFFTRYVYKVNWGGNILPVIFICFTMTLFTAGLGILIALLVPHENKGGTLISVLVPLSTLLAGGYVPWPSFGGWLDRLKLLSPNYLAQQALFRYIYGGSFRLSAPYLMSLWALIFIMILVVIRLRRRQVS